MSYLVGHLPEWIAAHGDRASGTGDPCHDLNALTGGKSSPRNHGIRGAECNALWKVAIQALDRERRTALDGIPHENE